MHPTALLAITCLFLVGPNIAVAQEEPSTNTPPIIPREFRAAWIASVWNLHWPSKPGLSKERQQTELTDLLDLAQELHLNAV
ncbi:MAG: hypothetical protein AAGD22_12855, partial [Verrucomicrobiota bacterium]